MGGTVGGAHPLLRREEQRLEEAVLRVAQLAHQPRVVAQLDVAAGVWLLLERCEDWHLLPEHTELGERAAVDEPGWNMGWDMGWGGVGWGWGGHMMG